LPLHLVVAKVQVGANFAVEVEVVRAAAEGPAALASAGDGLTTMQ